ncbi:uncharacterized protein [Nicotiana tomentosiformis]|uniref:uncharacterized protein n=1 Tax=Nicotiana tomentosiformis TaxID=4098 RepID=UPI00388C6D5B
MDRLASEKETAREKMALVEVQWTSEWQEKKPKNGLNESKTSSLKWDRPLLNGMPSARKLKQQSLVGGWISGCNTFRSVIFGRPTGRGRPRASRPIEILKSLALEDDATERIGGTGGILKELCNIFLKESIPNNHGQVRSAAGEALAMLALESKNNCHRILKLKVTGKLVEALEVPLLRVNAARILRNLCVYSGSGYFEELRELAVAGPTVLKAIMTEENKLQEVMMGVGAHIFKFITPEESSIMFQRAKIQEAKLAAKLVEILRKHQHPSIKVPRIRRFVIELSIWMMRDKRTNIQVFRNLGMDKEVEYIIETTSELESLRALMFSQEQLE